MLIAIEREGGVSIMSLDESLDIDTEVEKWRASSGNSKYVSHREVDSVPEDRTFREAWNLNKEGVAPNMIKAREIQRERMRIARKPILETLDVETMKNIRNNSKLDEVEIKKQELRDVTADPAIEAATTPEELKAVWPECLK